MKTALLPLALSLALPFVTEAGPRSSASYGVTADTVDGGGRKTTSAKYGNDISLGGLGGAGTASANYAAKPGYGGQLFRVTAFAFSANPTNVNEGASSQLNSAATLDDGTATLVTPTAVHWSFPVGGVSSVSTGGVATAAHVYQDTPATIRGDYLDAFGTVNFNIFNVGHDDFGLYAGDGLPDEWQVQYFGEGNTNAAAAADPDSDRENNLFEYVAGTLPTNAASAFALVISTVPGQSLQRALTFSPRLTNRLYSVEFTPQLGTGAAFSNLTQFSITDNGTTRTVTDTNATAGTRFYRVKISLP